MERERHRFGPVEAPSFTAGRKRGRSARRVPILDELAQHVERRPADRAREAGRRAQRRAARPDVDALCSKAPGRHTLERVDEPGERDLRRVAYEQVDVVRLAVDLVKIGLEVRADGVEDLVQPLVGSGIEDATAVLRDEHEVRVQQVNDVPPPPKLGWCHAVRPSTIDGP